MCKRSPEFDTRNYLGHYFASVVNTNAYIDVEFARDRKSLEATRNHIETVAFMMQKKVEQPEGQPEGQPINVRALGHIHGILLSIVMMDFQIKNRIKTMFPGHPCEAVKSAIVEYCGADDTGKAFYHDAMQIIDLNYAKIISALGRNSPAEIIRANVLNTMTAYGGKPIRTGLFTYIDTKARFADISNYALIAIANTVMPRGVLATTVA